MPMLVKISDALVSALRALVTAAIVRTCGTIAIAIGAGAWCFSQVVSWLPSTLRVAACGCKLALVLSPVITVLFLLFCAVANPFVREGLNYAHDRSSAAEVFDADGRWIGII